MTTLQDQLVSKGYKKWVSEATRKFKMTDTLYQKCITDEKGKKYFIDLYYYPETKHYYYNDLNENGTVKTDNFVVLPESIQAEVQFTGDGVTDEHMDVKLFTKDIDKIEEVFENMWVKLGLGYYELWLWFPRIFTEFRRIF